MSLKEKPITKEVEDLDLKSVKKVSDKIITGAKYTKTNAKENDGDSIKLIPKDKLILLD